eukprot:7159309-Prymnesium_polylepis.3
MHRAAGRERGQPPIDRVRGAQHHHHERRAGHPREHQADPAGDHTAPRADVQDADRLQVSLAAPQRCSGGAADERRWNSC